MCLQKLTRKPSRQLGKDLDQAVALELSQPVIQTLSSLDFDLE
jgi:hypothetical protein